MSGHLILGKDTANNKYVPISVDSSGHLDIDVQVADLDSKCMGSETGATDGTQRQLRVDTTGALHIISENYDSMLIKGVETGTSTQRDCKQNSNGDLRSALVGNTAKDGTGTNYYVVVDSDGKLESTAGDATAANQTTQIANDATIIARIGTSNSTLTDIEAHQGNIENNLSSIQSTVSSNKLQVDVITSALPSGAATETTLAAAEVHLGNIDGNITACNTGAVVVSSSALPTGAATQATLADVEAHQGNIENNLSSIQSTVSSNKLQVDVITSALPSGAATETTLAAAEVHLGAIDTSCSSIQSNVSTSANQTTMITHLSEIEGAVETIETCVSGTELQVDVRNRTDSAPNALTFTAGNKIIGASGITTTAAIDVGGCSNYSIMLNMLTATANSADLLSCKVIIEYSPDDGSTFMGTVSASGGGAPESIVPAALYEPTGGASSTVIGYGVYIVPTLNMTAPTAGNTRSNKIRVKVQNNSANALTLDSFAIYKFN